MDNNLVTISDLVVDDSAMACKYIRRVLSKMGITSFQEAVNGHDAIPVIENNDNRLTAVQQSGVSGICNKPFEPDTVKTYLQKIMADL